MKERIISVPKNKDGEVALDYNKATSDQLVEIVLNESEFNSLWKNNIFKIINNSSNANIDDCEDESITNMDSIKNTIHVLKTKETSLDKDVLNKVTEIRTLFEEALIRGTGVYFYF